MILYLKVPSGHMTQNDVVPKSMRRDDVASTSIQRHFGIICPMGSICEVSLIPLDCTPQMVNVLLPLLMIEQIHSTLDILNSKFISATDISK